MTVAEQIPITQHTANGSTDTFAYNFELTSADEVAVYIGSVQQSSAALTFTGLNTDNGGTIQFDSAPASGSIITIVRNMTVARDADYANSGSIAAQTLNNDLDKLWLFAQQMSSKLNERGLTFSDFAVRSSGQNKIPDPEDSKVLSWSNGALVNLDLPTVSINSTNLFALNIAALKSITGVSTNTHCLVSRHTVAGWGGGYYRYVEGVSAGTYVDNNGTIILPTGGDGSAAWIYVENQTISADTFGAVGDGVVDCTAAIQAAIDYVASFGGGSVYLRAGTYIVSTLVRLATRVKLYGSGAGSIIKADGVSVFQGSWVGDETTSGIISMHGIEGAMVSDLAIDGNSEVKNDAKSYGIHIQECTNYLVTRVWIRNIPSDNASKQQGGDAINVQDKDLTDVNALNGIITEFKIENCYRQGIAVTFAKRLAISDGNIECRSDALEGIDIEPNASDRIDDITISNVNINGAQFGIAVAGAGPIFNVSINGGTITGCREGAIVVTPSSGGSIPNEVTVTGVAMKGNNTNNKIEADCEGDISVKANIVNITGCNGKDGGTCGIRAWECNTVNITGNIFKDYRYSCIWVAADRGLANSSANNITINDNTCMNAGKAGSGTHHGIKLTDASTKTIDNLTIEGNRCGDDQSVKTQNYGLAYIGTASNQDTWEIGSNNLSGNKDGGYFNDVTGKLDAFNYKEVTIASGSIANPRPSSKYPVKLSVIAEAGGGGTDNLDAITGMSQGSQVYLRAASGNAITLRNAAVGSNALRTGSDRILNSSRDFAWFEFDEAIGENIMLQFLDNA